MRKSVIRSWLNSMFEKIIFLSDFLLNIFKLKNVCELIKIMINKVFIATLVTKPSSSHLPELKTERHK